MACLWHSLSLSVVSHADCISLLFLSDVDCLKLLLSKALGYLVILGSVAVKLPQILSIARAQSAAGISLSMFVLELIGFTITLGYNVSRQNPFSTWGENFFLLTQTAIIVVLMLYYSKLLGVISVSALALWVVALAAMITGQVPAEMMTLLQTASVGLFVASKVPQIISNFRDRSTGKLSAITFFLSTAGAGARVFTTLQEVNDQVILLSAVLGFSLNLIITLQIFIFGDRSATQAGGAKADKKKKKVE